MLLVGGLLAFSLAVPIGGPALALETTSAGDASEGRGPLRLDALVSEALASNPEIEASAAQWEMFVQQARQAGSFEDPMMMVGVSNGMVRDPFNFSRDEMTAKVIGLSQMVPFFGKRGLAREVAEKKALSARARYEERKLELAAMVKETAARLFAVDRSLEIVGRSLKVMDDMVRFTESRYGVGTGMQQDVLRAQVERSRMLDMQIGLQQQRRSLLAALNRLLFRPAGTALETLLDLEAPPVTLSAEQLQELALKSRPLLAGLAAQVDRGKLTERLAAKEFYPDFTFALEYMQREPAMESRGFDMYGATVSFNLPVQRQRRHAMVAEAQAETRMALAEKEDLLNRIRNGIEDLLARTERASKQVELYRNGILPQASGSFEASRIAYQNNKVDFDMMMDSLLTLYQDQRQYYEMVADYHMSLAQLEALVGTGLGWKP
jgi:outer membrane protein TolC